MKKLLLISAVALLVSGVAGVATAHIYYWEGTATGFWETFWICYDTEADTFSGEWYGSNCSGELHGESVSPVPGGVDGEGYFTDDDGGHYEGLWWGRFIYRGYCEGIYRAYTDPPGGGTFSTD